jgi:ATP-dependent RNA helicase DDX5/DBP2
MRFNVHVEISLETLATSTPIKSFENMNLHPNIMKDIVFHSYTIPIPIQAQAFPMVLFGCDLLGCTKTRSKKIAAFAFLFI